jgi:hypothetical protein
MSLLDPQQTHLDEIIKDQALVRLHEQLQTGTANPKVVGPIAALELWCRS